MQGDATTVMANVIAGSDLRARAIASSVIAKAEAAKAEALVLASNVNPFSIDIAAASRLRALGDYHWHLVNLGPALAVSVPMFVVFLCMSAFLES